MRQRAQPGTEEVGGIGSGWPDPESEKEAARERACSRFHGLPRSLGTQRCASHGIHSPRQKTLILKLGLGKGGRAHCIRPKRGHNSNRTASYDTSGDPDTCGKTCGAWHPGSNSKTAAANRIPFETSHKNASESGGARRPPITQPEKPAQMSAHQNA
ncbi:hypothetical protein MHYP_G00321050 [Metynnis hypsauchen]